jgi:hypothetical protein
MPKRSKWLPGLAVAILAVGGLAGAALQEQTVVTPVRPEPEKICPISFHLFPTTSLQDRIAKDAEKTNAQLAQDLVDWRSAKAVLPGYETERQKLVKKLEDIYAGTYLHYPVLWDENGLPHEGWGAILAHLGTIYPKAHYIHPQSVNAYLEYLPKDGPPSAKDLAGRYAGMMKTLGISTLWFDRDKADFLVNIRTVIAYAPHDGPLEIGNALPIPHRTICTLIY